MKRTSKSINKAAVAISIAAALFLVVWPAWADEPAGGTAAPPENPTAKAEGALETQANANAQARAGEVLANIREAGAKVDAKAREKFEADVAMTSGQVDADAAAVGDAKVAERLAAEFGVTADALIAEKNETGASWGQLMIAHALAANASSEVTARQLFALRMEGMGWGAIAHGMGLRLGPAIAALKAEARVARGLERADGKVAAMRGTAAGSRANAAAKGGAKAGVNAGAAGSNAKVGAGAGVSVGGNAKVGK